ncbi:DUF948 domain-containing protein [Microcoleus sp. FACHB-68]|uniref:DUF948 domain-containing protein n=1 Tax=Microcoleus sp. FACHB-68 TaxID=2692826 RepID=UPI00168518AC|nr:DUF948 domain-containing protein [Microcoleus sp. FACHB-68]
MIDPIFWLGLSILLVAVSLTAVLVAALPALQELARAARSVEKLAETLSRELPPTLEAIRLTGMEISDLTDDVSEGVNSATDVVKQVDQTLGSAKQQAKKAQVTTRSVFAGIQTAWKTFTRPSAGSEATRRPVGRLPASQRPPFEVRDRLNSPEESGRNGDDVPSGQNPSASRLPPRLEDAGQPDWEIAPPPASDIPPPDR